VNPIRAGLVGITGYAGMELARVVSAHPSMRLTMACSRAEAGKRLGEYYPFLEKLPGSQVTISVFTPELAKAECDLVFLAVPQGTAMGMAVPLLEAGLKVVDFSADFRLKDHDVYERWYGHDHTAQDLLPEAVYGIPELREKEIAAARLVANPGCYPTSVILGLKAALEHDLVDPSDIIIDAKSGSSGAGRKSVVPMLFCEVSDSLRAYGLPRHRHTPEIEQELSLLAGTPLRVSFNPHLLPTIRGIHSTIYAKLKNPSTTLDEVHERFCATWKDATWVRVLPKGNFPETRNVRGTMFCDIGLAVDARTGRLIVCSVIDNLCRGAAGQALANANLMCGLPASTGLVACPLT
jgi:N-acetyl-gamma-glutamyl-phosphate reductase